MLPIRTILHPTDFSGRAGDAFQFACALARDYRARLILLHVHPPPPPPVAGEFGFLPTEGAPDRTRLRERLSELRPADPRVPVEHHYREGDPATEILQTARESQCDLIVLGTHGRTGLDRLFMGSVAESVLRRATCPVLTVRSAATVALPESSRVEERAIVT